ncbi:MAG: hypothetical protein NC205_02190 [Prevotella sp.]|nr:hypothetical protein [Alistipes senegalensis]MCM1357377.1 hypothetical protein [Prevotella sp.]
MHKKLNTGLNLGLIGNALFIIFSAVCFVYYLIYDPEKKFTKFLEITAYVCEFSGFGVLILSDIIIIKTARMRDWLKIGFSVYIVVEAVMMTLELNSYRIDFYKPYSLLLAILHSIFSAAVCFAFLTLDPDKKAYEIITIICIGIILGGMLGNVMGIRIYFSIFTNAISFTVLFASIKFMLKRETIEIDCYGDRARVAEYRSTFFED